MEIVLVQCKLVIYYDILLVLTEDCPPITDDLLGLTKNVVNRQCGSLGLCSALSKPSYMEHIYTFSYSLIAYEYF